MAEQKFSDYVEARRVLADRGIGEEQYIELFNLLDTVTSMDLETIRNGQFHDDAFDLAVGIKAATDKNVRQVSAFLRRFAEHVVGQLHNGEPEKITEIVDRLPQMVGRSEEADSA